MTMHTELVSAPRDSKRGICVIVGAILCAGFAAGASPAAAEASLDPLGSPVAELQEAQFEYRVDIRGVVAVIDARQVIVNSGKRTHEAIYTFDLPIDSAVQGLSIRLSDGRTSSSALIDADSAIAPMKTRPNAGGSDLGLLRLVARDKDAEGLYTRATYEARIYPIAPNTTATVTIRWVTPLRYIDGRLSLRIPDRGRAANTVRERVALSMTPPMGARGFGAVHGGGKLLGKRIGRAQFNAPPRGDLVIEAVPDFGERREPIVGFSAAPLGNGVGVIGLSMLAPLPSGDAKLEYERALFVVDVSRSLDGGGLRAAATMADALMAALPGETLVEAITFDRAARRVFGKFRRNGGQTRKLLGQALRPGSLRNGSDLGLALELAHEALSKEKLGARPLAGLERGVRAPTLVVVISDGMVPLALTPQRAVDRLGDEIINNIDIFALTLVPDTTPVPDVDQGVLGELAHRTPGRSIAVRYGEAQARRDNLAAELMRSAPIDSIALETGASVVDMGLAPQTIEPGQGVIGVRFYQGPPLRALAVVGRSRGKRVRIAGRTDPQFARHVQALAIAGSSATDLVPAFGGTDADADTELDSATLEQAEFDLITAARRTKTVTQHTSLVALDSRDRFARDRLAMVTKWGPTAFFRVPPDPERQPNHAFRAFAERTASAQTQAETRHQRTGELDRDILERLLTTYVVPKAKQCYQHSLRSAPDLRGSLTVIVELARGEVQAARIEDSTFPGVTMERCVADAAYTIQVPQVAQGSDEESIGVARYPLSFRRNDLGPEVAPAPKSDRMVIDPDAPLRRDE